MAHGTSPPKAFAVVLPVCAVVATMLDTLWPLPDPPTAPMTHLIGHQDESEPGGRGAWIFFVLVTGTLMTDTLWAVLAANSQHRPIFADQLRKRCFVDLAVGRVLLCKIVLSRQRALRAKLHALLRGKQPLGPGLFPVRTGLPASEVSLWNPEWLSVPPWETHTLRLAAWCGMLGIQPQLMLLVAAMLFLHQRAAFQSYFPKYDHGDHCFAPLLVLYSLAPCGRALLPIRWLTARMCRWAHRNASTTKRELDPLLSRPVVDGKEGLHDGGWRTCTRRVDVACGHYITCAMLLFGSSYFSAGWPKLVCHARQGALPRSLLAWATDGSMRHIMEWKFLQHGQPFQGGWQPLCPATWHTLISAIRELSPSTLISTLSGLHLDCILGRQYLLPLLPRIELWPLMLMSMSTVAIFWELTFWLCAFFTGCVQTLFLITGALFHQANGWLFNIWFSDQMDLYLLLLPWGRILSAIGFSVSSVEAADDRVGTPLLTAATIFCFGFSALQVHAGQVNSIAVGVNGYPIAGMPTFCGGTHSETSPQHFLRVRAADFLLINQSTTLDPPFRVGADGLAVRLNTQLNSALNLGTDPRKKPLSIWSGKLKRKLQASCSIWEEASFCLLRAYQIRMPQQILFHISQYSHFPKDQPREAVDFGGTPKVEILVTIRQPRYHNVAQSEPGIHRPLLSTQHLLRIKCGQSHGHQSHGMLGHHGARRRQQQGKARTDNRSRKRSNSSARH